MNKRKKLIIFTILVSSIIIGSGTYLLLREKNIREQNNYPSKTPPVEEFTMVRERGYYSSSTYQITKDKTLKTLAFIDTTLMALSQDNEKINMTLSIRSYDQKITYSFAETEFFLYKSLSQNLPPITINSQNYNELKIGNNYQAIFLFSNNETILLGNDLKSYCESSSVTPFLEIYCNRLEKLHFSTYIPNQSYFEDLRIENPQYFGNLIFLGYFEL
jgi:AAA15 family ATPase/GTPase